MQIDYRSFNKVEKRGQSGTDCHGLRPTGNPFFRPCFKKQGTGVCLSLAENFILESVKKLEKLFIAPKARQILHETAHRAFARCECA